MPLLGKKIFVCVKPLVNRKSEETIYSIPHTKEQFRSKQDYEKRISLYEDDIWTCQSTGHTNLTHEEAWNSEKSVKKTLRSQYITCYEKPVLEIVHHSTHSLDILVDQTWLKLQQVLSIDEKVSLKIRTSGKVVKAKIVRVDTCGIEANPTSNCSSPSSDKENTNENSANKDTGQKKWVPPKLLPYKYSIRLDDEDKIINCVPAADLTRVDRSPSKELLRLFIRTHALRAGLTFSSPWVVDEIMIKKHNIQNKIADVFLSPMKIQEHAALNESGTKRKSLSKSPGSSSAKKAKTEKVKKNVKKKKLDIVSPKKKISTLKKKSPNHKLKSPAADDTSDADSDSSEECPLGTLKQKLPIMKDDDIPLSTLKLQLTPVKVKKSDSRQSTPKKNTPKKGTPKKNKSPQKDQTKSKKKSVKDDKKKKDKKGKEKDKKKDKLKEKIKEKMKDKSKVKETPKKGKNMKQMTLLEMSAKKTPRTPDKKKTVTAASPQKPPLIVRKLMSAMKNKDANRAEYKKILEKVVVHLSAQQREKLPAEVKDVVKKAYELHEEKKKLKSMSAEEREAYLQKKKEEAKIKQAEERKAKQAEIRKKRRELNRRYEDKDLEQKALPKPKAVPNPDGLSVEAFGDVTMITEFINCFSGLFMPQEEQVFYTDLLMNALDSGNEGFPYISQILVILLQTLLQDEISEDYSELDTPLSDIPVNAFTASELVRLALRKNDIDGPDGSQSDASSEDGVEEELEVNEELIEMLENHELQELSSMQKLQILKGLCLRIMGTYSVQDYMERKQADASSLWRRKLSSYKEKKQNRELQGVKILQTKIEDLNDTKENNPQNGNVKEESPRNIKSSGLTITDFYGNKVIEDEAEAEVPDVSLASVVKRRRQRAAVAAQEKEKRDKEERERREKENAILRKIKEEQAFEKAFADGILFAKMVFRLTPIGTDRNHNRYWIFSKSTPGLYIEKGWIHESTRTSRTETALEESSESSDDEAVSNSDNYMHYNIKDIETSVPSTGQNLWYVYDTIEELDNLMGCLHPQGVRESALKTEIKKRWDDIVKHFTTLKRVLPKEEISKEENSGEKDVMASFKKELKETETRLRNGGLGGVFGQQEWEEKLDNAVTLSQLGDCLLDTKNSVLERFLQGIMGKSKRKGTDSDKKEDKKDDKKDDTDKKDDSTVKEEEEKELINVGYQKWKEAVENCHTVSRMHVLLGILDACVKWEKSAENSKCKICRKKGFGEQLILCDECNQAFHLYCLRPTLSWIPEGDWYCPSCIPQSERRSRRSTSRKKYQGSDDEEEEELESDEDGSGESEHESNCAVCDGTDELIECSQCPDVYHLECHDPPLRHPPRGKWICTTCKTGKRRRRRPGSRQPPNKKKSAPARRKAAKESSSEEEESEEEEEEESEEEEEEESEEEAEEDGDECDEDQEQEGDEEEFKYIPKKVPRKTRQKKNVKTTKSKADSEEGSQEEEEDDECEDVPNSDEEYVSAVAAQCQEKCQASVSTQTSFTKGAASRSSSRQTGTQTATSENNSSERQQQNMELSICEAILIRLIMNKASWPFRLPVDEKEVPDYYELIVNPIDLRTIKHKTVDHEYKYTEHFIEDMSLMFRNCACYNSVNSEVYQCMLVLEKQFTSLLTKFLPQYVYSRKKSNGYTDQSYTCYGTKKRGHCM